MPLKHWAIATLFIGVISCSSNHEKTSTNKTYTDVQVVGAMKNIMWKGELGGSIYLDTLSNKKGLYGLGPVSFLTGELLINNGQSYVSKATSDSTMSVQKTFDVSAPFFVYANVNDWEAIELPANIKVIEDLQEFIDNKTSEFKRPFVYKLIGKVKNALIHIQNLPEGTKVSSPEEAHQGQVTYELKHESVEIIGFFSTEHKGVFTHHNSFLHMHLITKDESKMGHLDKVEIENMKLYLPKR